ncbi:MAG: M48 family metallopeptidase [Chlorobiaceae bacterium]|nr:M48 family metallopeptidase [Chlorobiaceae bacterium]
MPDPSQQIPYTIRVSHRAKHARLKLSPHEGLIVVIPQRFDKKRVPELVESRREWITKVQGTFEQRRLEGVSDTGKALPSRIELNGIGEAWSVSYRAEDRTGVLLREVSEGELLLAGLVHDEALCRRVLESWLKRRAGRKLVPQLERLATIHGFTYSSVSVRKQRSRWGSCSSKGRISLNLKLLFLPPLLVRYIMVHELCHTLHMNHSSRYWGEVARFDPDYAANDREMTHAWRFVPGWLAAE